MDHDFPVTRGIVGRLGGWVNSLAAPVLPATPTNCKRGLRWEFAEQSSRTLLIAKAVRMVSAVNAALRLTDLGFVTEGASLLRMVSDFGVEIVAMCEAMFRDAPTTALVKFLEDFFAGDPTDSADASRAEDRYIGRKELLKSEVRLTEAAGLDSVRLRELRRALNRGYDAYVHAGYTTAIELYHPIRAEFMLEGHEGEIVRCQHRTAVAGKLHEVIYALELIAQALENPGVEAELTEARRTIDASAEQDGSECRKA